jgi:SAM-dependent methyltransferase
MMKVAAQRQDWDDMSELDPLWAVLSAEDKRGRGWSLDEFMGSGHTEIAALMERALVLGRPRERGSALDFGCGAGRVTRALADYFQTSVGVDISPKMIEYARQLHLDIQGCKFIASAERDLSFFGADQFDLVYSRLVLQHIPSPRGILRYVEDFVRVLAPGGLLAFQVPTHIPLHHRLQPRPRLYRTLRSFGLSRETLYRRLNLHPIRMSCVPRRPLEAALVSAGGWIIDAEVRNIPGGISSSMYYVTK